MNWSLIILGLVAISSVAIAENSYLIIVPKLFKVGYENQLSIFIGAEKQPVDVKFELTVGQHRIQGLTTVKAGETRNATLALPMEFPVGPAELTIIGTGGITFEEKRDIIVYDNRYVVLVQTSASTYRPEDEMEIRVVVTDEKLMPVDNLEVLIEVFDANLKLVGDIPSIPVRSGLTETYRFPIGRHCNIGTWLVSATVANTTSSIEVLVAEPATPSFDLKAIFQRFLLRTDKTLRGVVEIDGDNNEPIFGRAIIAVGAITEQDAETMMKEQKEKMEVSRKDSSKQEQKPLSEEWRKWKSQKFEIAGRVEINYDLLSLFEIDVTKVLAVQVYIQVTELASGQERFIQHIIPVFTRDVVYDIRPLEFVAGIENEFEVIAKRPDGKPAKMEDLIVSITMMMGNEQGKFQDEKVVEIKDFYTRGRNDIGFFNIAIPEKCIGVLMTITPLGEDGKVRGYRTHAIPLMPQPSADVNGGKLTIELLPSTTSSVSSDVNTPVISSQISTIDRTSNFYIQLVPPKSIQKFERLPMSYVVLTNGRITFTGEFMMMPTKECGTQKRSMKPEESRAPVCVWNGTLPIQITREMTPYSTLLVYTFQPLLGINVAESYRFSVAGLFKAPLTLNATVVPYSTVESMANDEMSGFYNDFSSSEDADLKSVSVSNGAQDRRRVELSFTGAPESIVGLNVVEYDAVVQGLSGEMTKERVLHYLTQYEQVPIMGMPTFGSPLEHSAEPHKREFPHHEIEKMNGERHERPEEFRHPESEHKGEFDGHKGLRAVVSEEEEERNMDLEHTGYKVRYPIEKMIFGVAPTRGLKPIEGDDVYTTSSMGRLYGDVQGQRTPETRYRRRGGKSSAGQYDVTVSDNDFVVATSIPVAFKATTNQPTEKPVGQDDVEVGQQGSQYGSSAWYERMNSKLSKISQEAFTFMQSGLTIVSDFSSLRIPSEMRRTNLTNIFNGYKRRSAMDFQSFSIRDEARQLLDEYLVESGSSMLPPAIMLEEQARTGYYRSIFFNTSRIEASGTGKVVLPRTKPYSTWLATGFALNAKSGLSVAQPIRLPTNQGLYILANFPDQVQMGEHILLTYGINNYLGKDLSNCIVRIRASADFDLIEQAQSERIASSNGKDYTITIPSIPMNGVVTRNIVLVPKRAGVVKILLEVESEFGGDYEVLTTYVRESGIERREFSTHLFDLISDKKSYGPIVEKMTPSPFLRSVRFEVSGTGLDKLVERYTTETSALVGVDRAIIRLWRLLGLRRYLNETLQTELPLFMEAAGNMSSAYQKLQLYNNYNGSYSFISDQGEQKSSLFLTTLAFGSIMSPFMPVRDYVTMNRTLSWILSQQREDGSFDDMGPCFHYRFCSGEFRRESLTALVLYTMTRHNISRFAPEFVRQQLFMGEQSPIFRAQRYLESRLDAVKSCLLTTSLIQLSLVQCQSLPAPMRQRIFDDVRSRQLTVMPEDGSKYFKYTSEKMTIEDELLLNSLMVSLYATFGDMKTTSDMARWIVQQSAIYRFDTILDGVFLTEAWIMTDCLYRQRFDREKFSVIVDVTTDNGQKQQFKIDSKNMDITQKFRFTLPVNTITYSVSGFGFVAVTIRQMFIEKQQQMVKQVPFTLTNDFLPMPWLSEIVTKTCLTYTPTVKDQQFAKDTFNRTVIVEVQLPSGMRINLRQIGFFLSRVPEAMYFTYNRRCNSISFFLNVPSTMYGKPICLEWCLERLSFVSSWAPIKIRAYDYLDQATELVRLMPMQLQPNLLGYSFVDAVHKARPTVEQLKKIQETMMTKNKPVNL
ncbi:unnamed protein product [Adineta steineri]|uniref:Alpha-2-macroglobulin domain-containing protein n=1 Tax=Adineta steineri TaxID=433720 RepID=A0A813RGI0_9BILA|nr:unnamed protein product [Adineta steineri]CAF3544251.1 unnamed protein product [Adineta steineri]